jgi:GTP:adenosylcobinamide-phosphate guanylyltransferase
MHPQPTGWTAVVIAAGHDQLVAQTPAPLLPIAGMTNLGRVIKTARYAGATRCQLLVSPQSDALVAEARANWDGSESLQVELVPQQQSDLQAIRACLLSASTPAVVLFADLAFSRNLLQALVTEDSEGAAGVAAVGTAAWFEQDAIHPNLGAEGTRFAGMLLCTPGFHEHLPENAASLGAALVELAKRGVVRLRPMGNSFTYRIASIAGQKQAEALQVRSLRRNTDGLVSRWLNRPVSLFLSRFLFSRLPFGPNQITLFAGAIGWVAIGLMFAWPGYWWVLIGAFLFHVSSILDGCDGEVARLRFQFSRFGEWLDNVLDEINNAAFIAGIGVGIWKAGGHPAYLWAALGYFAAVAIVDAGSFYQMIRWRGGSGSIDNIRWFFQKEHAGPPPDPTAFPGRMGIGDLLMQLPRRDFYILMLLILAACDVLYIGFWISVAAATVLFALGSIQWAWMLAGGPDRRA